MPYKFYTCAQVAELCSLTRRTIWRKIREGKLIAHRKAGTNHYLIRDDYLTDFQLREIKPRIAE